MLSVRLPLLPFSSTRLPKKEWTGNDQEKKGRPIDIATLQESILSGERCKERLAAGLDEESDSDGSEDSKDTADYMSEDSWDDEKEYEDDDGVGLAQHIKELPPEKAVVGKAQPKLVKPPPPVVKKEHVPGFFGRQWLNFKAWREKEKARPSCTKSG